MTDLPTWLVYGFRLIVGAPIITLGFGLIGGSWELLGFALGLVGIAIAVPGVLAPVLRIVGVLAVVPLGLGFLWWTDTFVTPPRWRLDFWSWLESEWLGLVFLAFVGVIAKWWQGGDPFKDRKL